MSSNLTNQDFPHVIVQSTQQSVWVFCNDAYRAAGRSFGLSFHTFTAQAGAQMGGKQLSSLRATLPFLCKSSAFFTFFYLLSFGSLFDYYPPLVYFYLLVDSLVNMNLSLKWQLLCLLHTEGYYHIIDLFLPLIYISNLMTAVIAEVPGIDLFVQKRLKN